MGHYVADAHVPLHLTQNYNGQLSGQTGIHALWESRIPELSANRYNFFVGKARYIENPLAEAFKICRVSYKSVDTVLRMERLLSKTYPADKKYGMVLHGKKEVNDYSDAYSLAYQKMLKGMIERQLRASILSVGSFWYSAWVDAGQPDLNKLIQEPLSANQKLSLQREEMMYRAGKCIYKAGK